MGNGTDLKPAVSNNNLINGKMNYDCSLVTDGTPCVSNAGISKFQFKPGKDHLLRVVNTGSAGLQFFTIDEHEMTIISNDFIPIKPYKTNSLTLGVSAPKKKPTKKIALLTLARLVNDPMSLCEGRQESMRIKRTGYALISQSTALLVGSHMASLQSITTKPTSQKTKPQKASPNP